MNLSSSGIFRSTKIKDASKSNIFTDLYILVNKGSSLKNAGFEGGFGRRMRWITKDNKSKIQIYHCQNKIKGHSQEMAIKYLIYPNK